MSCRWQGGSGGINGACIKVNKTNNMIELTKDQKFDAVKYRHEDQAELLRFMTSNDLKIFSSYFALQLFLGGFLVTNDIDSIPTKLGLIVIDIMIAVTASMLIFRSNQRRREVAKTINNCNRALGFEEEGVFLVGTVLNANSHFRPLSTIFYVGIVVAVVGIVFILFGDQLI